MRAGASQVSVGGQSASAAGRKLLAALELQRQLLLRRLLQSSQVLPVSIQAGANQQQVSQQLANLASSGNLTASLQALGAPAFRFVLRLGFHDDE